MMVQKGLTDLLKPAETLTAEMTVTDVADKILLSNNIKFLSLPVVDTCGNPLGMVSRYQLQDIFLQRYGRDLWGRRAVSHVMNTSPLLVPLGMSIEEAADQVTSRVQYPITEDFIFVDDQGRYQGIGIVLDLLEAMSEDLGRNRRALMRAQRIAGLASWEWSARNGTLMWSSQLNDLLKIDGIVAEAPTTVIIDAFDPASQNALREFFSAGTDHPPQTLELQTQESGWGRRFLEFHGEHFVDSETGDHRAVGTLRDITQRRLIEERLAHMANFDHLTSLPNRYLFQDRLQHALAQSNRSGNQVALLFLDIDRFKWINDALGHAAGDRLLQQVAQRLSCNLRKSDTVARLGGDEFTIILENLEHSAQVHHITRQILKAFNEKFTLGDRGISVSTSIGIAIYPNDADNLETLLTCADSAMYQAKEQGRDGYQFYTAELNQLAERRFLLEHGLRSALEQNEFELYFQPQLRADTGQLSGAEALLRWFPASGSVSPTEFIPLLEDLRLINPVGQWVLENACSAAAQWQRTTLAGVRVAVNLSVHQLRQPDFVDSLQDILSRTGLAPALLEIEVTESVLLDDRGGTAALLALNELGVRVAIDDFGTGYSSLSYLKQFSVNILKLDQTFVHDLTIDPDDEAIASAVISLAHALGMTVTAEGVETLSQEKFLKELECDHIQGFLISKPVPEAQFLEWAFKQAPDPCFRQHADTP